jgi:hypothetical protein
MTGGDDDYGDAFEEAKLEHDQRQQRSAAKQRLQAEVDADAAVVSADNCASLSLRGSLRVTTTPTSRPRHSYC